MDMIDGDMFALEKTGSEIVDLIALNVIGIKLINPKHKGCYFGYQNCGFADLRAVFLTV